MSAALVQKALYLLQDDEAPEKSKNKKNRDISWKLRKQRKQIKNQIESGSQKNKAVKEFYSGILILKRPVDKTEENLKVLEQLRCLKPKTAVAQKVMEFYSKRKDAAEEPLEAKPQSILFDDDIKEKKKRKK